MKKVLALVLCTFSSLAVFSQANILVKAPQGNNATTQVRAPNGNSSHTTMRGCFLVTAAELTPYMLPGTQISSFGFTLASGVSGSSCTGSFSVYIQNTSDNTYSKGTSYSTAVTPMTNVYAGNMTVPVSAASTSISVTLSSPFTYTGGGMYVAYDWISSGPFSSTVATYQADNSLANRGASNSTSVTPAIDLLGGTAFSPVFLWGAPNTATNDVQTVAIEAPGSVPGNLNTPHTIKGIVRNGSNTTLSNIPVTMSVTGANTYVNTLTITSLAAGAQTTVNFPGYNPQNNGISTLSLTVPADQLPLNDSKNYTQSLTCNFYGQAPQPATYTSGVGFATGSGIIGARMIPPVSTTCIATRIGISTDANTSGKSIWGVLLNASGTILAKSNTLTITSGMLGTSQILTYTAPVNVTGGTTYFVGVAQPASTGFHPVGAFPSTYVPASLYVTTFTTGGAPGIITQNLGYMWLDAVFSNTATVAATSASSVICAGYSVNLTASGANTYSWNTGATGSVVAVTPTTSPSTYTVNALTLAGCASSNTVEVSTTPSPTITVSSSNSVICSGNTTSLTASGADTYVWSNSSSGSVTAVSPTITSTYSVSGTNTVNGCASTNTISIVVNTPTISISSPSAICNGTVAPLTATGASSYTWSTSSTFSSVAVNPSVTTTYSVTGINSTSCTGTQTVQVIVKPSPTVALTAQPAGSICAGSSVTLSTAGADSYTLYTGTSNISYSGTPGTSVTTAASPSATQVYTATGTYTNGCAQTKTLQVTVQSCVGINENAASVELINMYPNPSFGQLTVEITLGSGKNVMDIYSTAGQKVQELILSEGKNEINLHGLAPGLYFISINGNQVKKLQIQ